MAPRSLKKTFVGCKTCKRFGEDLYLKEAERVSNCKCSKVFSMKKEVRGLELGINLTKVELN